METTSRIKDQRILNTSVIGLNRVCTRRAKHIALSFFHLLEVLGETCSLISILATMRAHNLFYVCNKRSIEVGLSLWPTGLSNMGFPFLLGLGTSFHFLPFPCWMDMIGDITTLLDWDFFIPALLFVIDCELNQCGLIIVQMISQDELIITRWQRVKDYINSDSSSKFTFSLLRLSIYLCILCTWLQTYSTSFNFMQLMHWWPYTFLDVLFF